MNAAAGAERSRKGQLCERIGIGFYFAFSDLSILRASGSLISLCRGTASTTPVLGFVQSECEPLLALNSIRQGATSFRGPFFSLDRYYGLDRVIWKTALCVGAPILEN
jgi:hypothetical protein